MGLDMYMYKIEKLSEEEVLSLVGLHVNDLREKYHCIEKESFDADPEMYSDLIPFISEIPIIATAFNYKACFAAHHIAKNDEVCGSFYGSDGAGWSFASGARVEISREEYDSYLYDIEVPIYVFKSEQAAYWREYYDLNEFIQTARIVCRAKHLLDTENRRPKDEEIWLWKTENCGYYMLSAEEKQAIKAYLAENEDADNGYYHSRWNDLLNDSESVLMYHAWW